MSLTKKSKEIPGYEREPFRTGHPKVIGINDPCIALEREICAERDAGSWYLVVRVT